MRKQTIIAIILFFVGALIYAVFRQDIIFIQWFGNAKLLELIKIDFYYKKGNVFAYFLLFCLADMLWYIALLLLQKQFYNSENIFSKIVLIISILLPFALEILQYFKVIQGTFDIIDILLYLFILIIFFVIWKRKKLKKVFYLHNLR